MNAKQQSAIRVMTNSIERFNRLSNDDTLYGPIHFRVEQLAGGMVMVSASNNSEDRRWYHKMVHVIATVGPRGGVKIRACDGIRASLI